MDNPTAKTALVTHRNCLDGTTSAAVFVFAGGLVENVFFKYPNECELSAEEAAPYDEVWFVDVCPVDLSDPAGGKPWRVIDHHDTNVRRHGEDREGCTFDVTKCGCSLLAGELGIRDLPSLKDLFDAVEHYDLGRFNEKNAEMVADIAAAHDQEEMLEIMLDRRRDVLYLGLYQGEARTVSHLRNAYALQAVNIARIFKLDDNINAAMSVGPGIWKNAIANLILDGRKIMGVVPDVAIIVDFAAMSVSMRSPKGGPNVAKIAEGYGGGGHPNAAAFRLSTKHAMELLFDGAFG